MAYRHSYLDIQHPHELTNASNSGRFSFVSSQRSFKQEETNNEKVKFHGRIEVGDRSRARRRRAGRGPVPPAREIGHDAVELAFPLQGRRFVGVSPSACS